MFARTYRLTLHPAWPEDAAAIASAIGHEAVVMNLGQVPWPYTEADARAFLSRPESGDDLFLLVLAHERGATWPIGGVGLHAAGDERELGYWFTPAAWGHGYATEAAQTMVSIARHELGLRRIVSAHFLDNPASGRVLAKLGFRVTGHGSRPCLARGHAVASALVTLEL